MDNLALKLIDEVLEGHEGFKIDNDGAAEWALKKIQEETAEANRIIMVCQTMINEYQAKANKAREQLENKTAFLKEQLRQYFNAVPKKVTKTAETYSLPSGNLKLKIKEPEFVRDEKLLGKFLFENNYKGYFEIVPKAKWAELKKLIGTELEVQDGIVVDTTNGLIVEGVTVQERDNEFIIEF